MLIQPNIWVECLTQTRVGARSMLSGRVLNATRHLGAPAEWEAEQNGHRAVYRLPRWTRRGCTPTAGSPMMATADRTRSWAVCAGRLFRKGQCLLRPKPSWSLAPTPRSGECNSGAWARLTWPRRARYSRIGCLKGAGDHLPAQLVDRADPRPALQRVVC
jgi:hypothetical protein